ncbi:hypothetical protein P175DRAFT_0489129 [Aspergillus ochraceoroseus IBT 24754]|uniref:Uncharacterized protein n=1 Tax=Aspergillus ochraceoroseus IBT 24754 TaxID=1392256 RepID=A0A2T5M5Z6_9EURO|nr:uncharacterized protein P175DRAFT_0489129 [Aspergillus ochraceoroseus IBT 24754]PTU23952.1 hypothetical protein P175DRAFT_0489129 [Aspergillus ochraceoroseus IBT 24754]
MEAGYWIKIEELCICPGKRISRFLHDLEWSSGLHNVGSHHMTLSNFFVCTIGSLWNLGAIKRSMYILSQSAISFAELLFLLCLDELAPIPGELTGCGPALWHLQYLKLVGQAGARGVVTGSLCTVSMQVRGANSRGTWLFLTLIQSPVVTILDAIETIFYMRPIQAARFAAELKDAGRAEYRPICDWCSWFITILGVYVLQLENVQFNLIHLQDKP